MDSCVRGHGDHSPEHPHACVAQYHRFTLCGLAFAHLQWKIVLSKQAGAGGCSGVYLADFHHPDA